jgi:ribonuclease HI
LSTGVAILHLDESCLGNGREGSNPGGSGGLVEARSKNGRIQRRDFFIHSPAATNNRMALAGAITALQLLARKGRQVRALLVSDSEYLVRGMREWVPGWRARGWKRRGGPIENLELWQELVACAERLQERPQWTWVRGHRTHAKNIYADGLAVTAAREQKTSNGLVESGFGEWLAELQAEGKFAGYDPDAAFTGSERRIAAGESFPLAEER